MTRGRKSKPTKLKKLEGNPGKRALNEQEPTPDVVIPDCPDHLQGEARKEWNRITQQLYALGILAEIDRAALAMYCAAWADYLFASRMVDEEGEVITSEKGGKYQNPWVGVKNTAMDRVLRISVEFGMTPSSRSRIKVEGPSEEDKMASFLFGKKTRVAK
jgi:P27 family predicted phage terminase small subunit